jgi:hypothetical protein
MNCRGGGSNELNACESSLPHEGVAATSLGAFLGEIGVFGEEAVARVDGLGAAFDGDVEDFVALEVA